MHRVIMNTPVNLVCDHINGNGLDNRRANLRNCTSAQNSANRRPGRNSSSRYKGVSWHKRKKKYIAKIGYLKRQIHLGEYKIEEAAARAHDKAARKLHGEFARLNFPDR